jgi:hypothetical protein
MADGPTLPVMLTFAGLAGETRTPAEPTVLAPEVGEALRRFFDAHPAVAAVRFELALDEAGEDIEYAAGTLHDAAGVALRDGREAQRAGAAFRQLLRQDAALAALPVALVVAMGGIEHTFVIHREATGAAPADPVAPPDDDHVA